MIGDSGHRRRGLPRTEQEAQAPTPLPPEGDVPSADTPAPPRRRSGLPRTVDAPVKHTAEPRAAKPDASEQTASERTAPTPRAVDHTEQAAEADAAAHAPPAEPAVSRRRSGLGSNPTPGPVSSPKPPPESTASATPEPAAPDSARARPATSAERPVAVSRTRSKTALWWAAVGIGGVVILAAAMVIAAQWFLGTEAGRNFLSRYPGQYEQPDAPGGYPWWLNWAHFFNAFLMVLVIKTGVQIRREIKPEAYWTPKWGRQRRISLTIWTHNALDLLWVLNGLVFVALLVATGYWSRVVPTSWEVFPNALSALVQYVSLDWPTTSDWAHYNSAQELAYFVTIFVAAPLAIATGVRMSGLWPGDKPMLNKAFPVEWARAVHFPVMIYFVTFILVHVILVFATDALRNLNQIYTGQDATNWTGFWLFVLSLIVIIGAAVAVRPVLVAPLASLFGRVGR